MELEIANLKKAFDAATRMDESLLGEQIRAIGFKCTRCARCCRAEFGDNTVTVFPFEIRRIMEKTVFKWEEIVIPTPSQDRDMEGNIHTFEWVLRKNGDCVFMKHGLCEIYECRPHICKTYPFYLQDGQLMVSECSGTGADMSKEESRKLAALLKGRYIIEITESIALLEKFRGFLPGGAGGICVHDSEGEHWI